jgi:hypothetical protein
MKIVYMIFALIVSTTAAHASIPISDLDLILQDPGVTKFFQENGVTSFESITRGPIAACGRNTPGDYQLVVMQAGIWKPCTLNILVKPSDGRCSGNSPRVVELQGGLSCQE